MHENKTCAIPKFKDALIAAISSHPKNVRDQQELRTLMVPELKLLYKQTYNLIPHPCNPTVPLGFCRGLKILKVGRRDFRQRSILCGVGR